jgi:predicted phosphodiesterase
MKPATMTAHHTALMAAAGLLLAPAISQGDEGQPAGGAGAQEPFAFVQMCDTQLGMGGYDHDVRTFRQAVGVINGMQPDFVVICGDLVSKANDTSFADFNGIKSGFKVPCHCAAGNHDVENQPTAESLAKYREQIGPDYYSFKHKGFTFLVANTQLWKAPLAGESEKHDAWFRRSLEEAKAGGSPVVLVVHYPIFLNKLDEKEKYFNLPVAKRREVLALCEANGVVAILGGHLHRFQSREHNGIQLVNGETTSRNVDKRPMGFRWWEVDEQRRMTHRFVPLEEGEVRDPEASPRPSSGPVSGTPR